ncbi:HtaA domain-containing protein [Streptomyces brasiliensis]|uniref:Htaa domain-containing protein n=1 Tax=Streptomyces brasiliensis TaxID=1954 RepID=A0A917UM91_9ACTN|nr:HtaA domain-containing protein [Streptomyces brasiliensis]GGJ67490.1 hypothetical protein GCM10010121_092740 [Streptomyces brasiliensis]
MTDATAASQELPTGLLWGLKASFLQYLSRLPDAKHSVDRGAVLGSEGRLLFPTDSLADYDAEIGTGTLRFAGDVRFPGHFGALFLMLVDPWVTITEGGATLSIADPATYPALDRRLTLLDLEPRPWVEHLGARLYPPMTATLRAEGVPLFNDVYQAGEPFDPVNLRVVV